MLKFLALAGCLMASLLMSVSPSQAQGYPNRQVQIILPYDAGGASDSTARVLAKKLSEEYKQQFVVINKPGISGILGAQFVSGSLPDGYTLLFAADTTTSAPFMMENLTVDLEKDLVPVTKIVDSPFTIVVNSKLPINNLKDLIAYAKDEKNHFQWGVGGFGTPGHLAIIRFETKAGFTAPKVPYSGEASAMTATMAGEVNAMLLSTTAAQGLAGNQYARLLAVATPKPLANFPDLPTIASADFPDFKAAAWYGVWGPKGLPPELALTVQKMFAKAMTEPEFDAFVLKSALSKNGSENPQQFAEEVKAAFANNGALIKSLNLPKK